MTIVAFQKEVSLKSLILFSKTIARQYCSFKLEKKHLISINGKKKFKRILVEGEKFKLRKLPSKDFIALFSSQRRAYLVLKHNRVMQGSILPVTIPAPGTPPGICNFFLSWRSIPHPRAHIKRQFPTPGTTYRPQIRCFVFKIWITILISIQ